MCKDKELKIQKKSKEEILEKLFRSLGTTQALMENEKSSVSNAANHIRINIEQVVNAIEVCELCEKRFHSNDKPDLVEKILRSISEGKYTLDEVSRALDEVRIITQDIVSTRAIY